MGPVPREALPPGVARRCPVSRHRLPRHWGSESAYGKGAGISAMTFPRQHLYNLTRCTGTNSLGRLCDLQAIGRGISETLGPRQTLCNKRCLGASSKPVPIGSGGSTLPLREKRKRPVPSGPVTSKKGFFELQGLPFSSGWKPQLPLAVSVPLDQGKPWGKSL